MPLLHWFRPPRSLLTLYLAGAVTGVVCLAWLAGRLLDQDQAVEPQRARAQLDVAADRAVAVFQRSLNELERQALAADGPPPPDTVAIVADRVSIRSRPPGRLVFVPVVPPSSELPPGIFTAGEQAEFGEAGPGATSISGLDGAIALAAATDALWRPWQDRPTTGQG